MRRILFVDDEPNILQALQRMLRPLRKEWEMAFAESGAEALHLLAQRPFDVIVSDMRMPGMDGAALLTEVMKRYPATVRFVLSGQSDKETVFRSIGPTHQFLAKPCDPDVLRAAVDRAFALRDLLGNENLKGLISQMPALPPVPELYAKLMKELQSPDASVGTVAKIIETDVGMTAKILQWVNSAFFCVRRHVSSPLQAASLLGLDTIRSLVLMLGVFSEVTFTKLPPRFSLEALSCHSMGVGACSEALCRKETVEDKLVSEAFTAGLLHDSGKLILAANCPREYGEVLARTQDNHQMLADAERGAFGCTHAEVGACLLGLWGLPDPVVEAVAFHHCPAKCPGQSFSPLTAVHVANILEHEEHTADRAAEPPQVDMDYLDRLGFQDRLSVWREVCSEIGKTEQNSQ